MAEDTVLKELFSKIDSRKQEYINDLKEAVSISSVSSIAEKLYEVMKMAYWVEDRMKQIGAKTEICKIEIPAESGEGSVQKPPVLLVAYGRNPRKRNLLVYGHLDVHHALREKDWYTNPFSLSERDGYLFGRGVSDNKGPVLCWIHLLELYHEMKQEPPVNIKLVLDGCEEIGSPGLEGLLRDKKRTFLKDVDFICITDCLKVGKKPCVVYGTRGITYFHLTVYGANTDVHSGVYGGVMHEPLSDLVYLLDALYTKCGKMNIVKVKDSVLEPSPDEEKAYNKVDFDVKEVREFTGVDKMLHKDTKARLLMHRWRLPSLSIHGIDGAFHEPGGRTVIPGRVTGKFSLRLVPNQNPEHVGQCVREHLEAAWKERRTANNMELCLSAAVAPWQDNPTHKHFQAALRALKIATGVEGQLIRHGGTVSGAATLQHVLGRSVAVIPLGGNDDNSHGNNERISLHDYLEGHKVVAAYLGQMANIKSLT